MAGLVPAICFTVHAAGCIRSFNTVLPAAREASRVSLLAPAKRTSRQMTE
jgi:hypothetical protein